jgi:hypothetical protein
MDAALKLAESVRRLAVAGLESADRAWDDEQSLALQMATAIGETAVTLLSVSALGQISMETPVLLH